MHWAIEEHRDGVEVLHKVGIPENPIRTVRWCIPERSAVAIGSAQPESDIDENAAKSMGIDIVRRKSGGGAVLI